MWNQNLISDKVLEQIGADKLYWDTIEEFLTIPKNLWVDETFVMLQLLCYTNIYQVFTVQCIGLITPNNASAARACVNSELWRRDCVQSSFKVYCWCGEVSVTTVLISTPPLCKWYVDTVLWRWVSCFRVNRPAHKELLVVLNAVYLQTVHVRWEKFMKFERKWCTGHGLY